VTGKYDSFRERALAGGATASEVDDAIAFMKAEDKKIDAGACPDCGSKITRTLDPRQSGPTEVAGMWFIYRCTRSCGWFTARCEPVGEN
jgi:DNA-directed RNA polymerase subunit RPC12/RpoP